MWMFDRLVAAGLLPLALIGCDGSVPPKSHSSGGEASLTDDGKVECAIGKGAAWTRDCGIERGAGADGQLLVLRHPDGGFRRLHIVADGRGVVSADGAEPVTLSIIGDRRVELAVGADRYRLPATIAAPRR